MRAAVLIALLAACGGGGDEAPGPAFAPARELVIVAHPGDDLTQMQPAIDAAIASGVTTLYVTAPAGKDADGVKAAYAAMLGSSAWQCGQTPLGEISVEHCRAGGVSLVFLAYPYGGTDGSAPDSLLQLWEANIQTATTAGRVPSELTQAALIRTVAALIDVTAPATLRTQEIAATHGSDESDHMLTGALALLATAASGQAPALRAYRGDNVVGEPANVDGTALARAETIASYFAACVSGCAACGQPCTADALAPAQRAALQRSLAVDFVAGSGVLRLDGSCVAVTAVGANAAMVDCASAPTWALGADGKLRSSNGLCLRVLPTGEVIATACTESGGSVRFFRDAEGHLWSGVPPLPTDDMAYAHLDCLGAAGGRPRAGLCGATVAPIWQLE